VEVNVATYNVKVEGCPYVSIEGHRLEAKPNTTIIYDDHDNVVAVIPNDGLQLIANAEAMGKKQPKA
jgi:hypothetical protein